MGNKILRNGFIVCAALFFCVSCSCSDDAKSKADSETSATDSADSDSDAIVSIDSESETATVNDTAASCVPTSAQLVSVSQTTTQKEFPVEMVIEGCNTMEPSVRYGVSRLYQRAIDVGKNTWRAYIPLTAGDNTLEGVVFSGSGAPLEVGQISVSYTPTTPVESEQSGYISGQVVDGKAGTPIVGATIYLRGVAGELKTDVNGAFRFPTPSAGRFLITVEAEGFTFGQRYVSVVTGATIGTAPLELMPLDTVTAHITPANGGTLSNSDNDISLSVPAGTVESEYDISGVSYPSAETLPRTLPDSSRWTQAFNMSPDGVRFSAPATVRLRNELGFAPGVAVPVGYYDRSAAAWLPETMGTVTADGQWIEAEIVHFSSYDCNFPTSENGRPQTGLAADDDCENGRLGSSVVSDMNGQLSLFVPFASVLVENAPKDYRLVYESEKATGDVHFLLPIELQGIDGLDRIETDLFVGPVHRTLEAAASETDDAYMLGASILADESDSLAQDGPEIIPAQLDIRALARTTYLEATAFGAPGGAETGVTTREAIPFHLERTQPVITARSTGGAMGAGWQFEKEEMLVMSESLGIAAHIRAGKKSVVALGTAGDQIGATAPTDPAGTLFDFHSLPSGEVAMVDTYGVSIAPSFDQLQAAVIIYRASDGGEIIGSTVTPDGEVVVYNMYGVATYIATDSSTVRSLDVPGAVMMWLAGNPDATESTFPLMFNVALSGAIATDRDGTLYVGSEGYGIVSILPEDQGSEIVPIPLTPGPSSVPSVSAMAYAEDEHALYILDRFSERVIRYDLLARNETVIANASDIPGIENITQALRLTYGPDKRLYYSSNQAYGRITTSGLHVPLSGPRFGVFQQDQCVPESINFVGNKAVLLCTQTENDLTPATFHELSMAHGNDLESGAQLTIDGNTASLSSAYDTRTFDSNGRLVSHQNLDGTATLNYTNNQLSRFTDAWGYTIDFTYSDGRLTTMSDSAGRAWAVAVNSANDLTSIQDADGTTASFSYGDHMMTARTVGGAAVNYEWDNSHRLTSATVAGQGEKQFRSVVESATTIGGVVPLSAAGSLLTVDASGDADTVERRYDSQGRLESILTSEGTWTLSYLADFSTGPQIVGDVTNAAQSILMQTPEGDETVLTRMNGEVVRFEQDGELILETMFGDNGLPTLESGPHDRCSYAYSESDGRLVEAFCGAFYASYAYDDDDQLPDRISNFSGYEWTVTYDTMGNIVGSENPEGGTRSYVRDAAGFVTQMTDERGVVTEFERNASGLTTGIRQGANDWTRFAYAAAATCDGCADHRVNRLSSVTNAAGQTWQFDIRADGQIAGITDPAGRSRTRTFDGRGRVTQISPGTNMDPVTLTYTDNGALSTVSSGADTDQFEYDNLGRMVAATNDRIRVTRSYNDITRTTTETVTDPASDVSYSVSWTETKNKISSFTSSAGHNQIVVFSDNAVINGLSDNGSFAGSTSFGFSINWGNGDYGERLAYDVDDVGVSDVDVYHDTLDRISQWSVYIGTDTYLFDELTVSYDGTTRLMTGLGASSGELFPSVTYEYDDQRRLIAHQATFTDQPAYASSYGYDAGGRLIAHSDIGTLAYDAGGALLSSDIATYTVSENGARLSRTDATTGTVKRYIYNGREQLSHIDTYASASDTNPSNTVSLIYDALGRLSRVDWNGVSTYYMWLDQVLLAELNEAGVPVRRYIPAETLDRVSIINQNNTNYFVADDPMGTVHRLVSASGITVARFDYDPWGNLLYSEGPLATSPRRFLGSLQLDSTGGLIYLRNRWYDPEVGQFITQDPSLDITATPHPYMYADNNPVYFCDPEGLCPDPVQSMTNITRDSVIGGTQFLDGKPGILAGAAGSIITFARGLSGYDGTVRGNARAGMRNYASITGLDNSPIMRGAMNNFMDFSENGLNIAGRNRMQQRGRRPCGRGSNTDAPRPRTPLFSRCP